MEDNKYYTPTIEEFHVGFEYEWFDGNIWNKSIQEYVDPGLFDNGDGEHSFEYQLSDIGIKVKYLDREDIESLGWNHIGSLWFEKGDYKLRKWKDQSLDIYFEYADKETIMIFRGDVKNKSELKKLMEQLNIK